LPVYIIKLNIDFIQMNKTIDAFLKSREIAVAGVSPRKGNWGMALVKELKKKGYTVYPVNPKHVEIDGMEIHASVKDLPGSVESLILAVNPERARSIIEECEGTGIRRVWMNQGVGDGAYSPEGIALAKEKNLEYVYGFCPMMFFGGGLHKFHYWMRTHLGKTPVEFSK